MADLRTKFMGIELKNPIIIGASNIITDLDAVKRLEDAGAAAFVYKSLFEEQIQLESLEFETQMQQFSNINAEMERLRPALEFAGPEEYLMSLYKTVNSTQLPVFASLNAIHPEVWVEWAREIKDTGVKGIELNLYSLPTDVSKSSPEIEEERLNIVKSVVDNLDLPVSVKLSPYYTNTLNMVQRIDQLGADAVVLFNRLFQPDIDIEKEEHFFPYNLSYENDMRLSLRYMGLLYGEIKAGLCANTGIMTSGDVIKMLLAGADTVQIVSTIYKHKPAFVAQIISEIEFWMESKKYHGIDDFRGKLSKSKIKDPFAYKRAQYVDILLRSNEINKIFPLY